MSDSKRAAKNAVALTIRMVIVTIVGLFTSRIVLQALGVDDYGIYGVIGGVVGMASFLNTSMASATSRFITYELGQNNTQKLKIIFSTALIIHIVIALIVAVLAETIGLWFVNNRMNFPPDRMFAVNVLYQFTILSMIVSFTQVPYTSEIFAHEKMGIYAYIEIAHVSLKLLIVYLLMIATTDRLILYAGLLLVVNVAIALFYRVYCTKKFPESHFSFIYDKEVMKEMVRYSGLNLYSHMCLAAKNQGQPILLNIFYGVVANAGASIALTVTGAINGLSTSIFQAFRPQIIKQYSMGNIDQSENMAKRAVQFSLMAFAFLTVPVIIETPTLLELWLGQIPQYSVIFTRIIIICCIITVIINTNSACIQATGNIKTISFLSGTFYLLSPVLSYIYLKLGGPAPSIYIVDAVMLIAVSIIGLVIIRKQISGYDIKDYSISIIKSVLVLIVSLIIVSVISYYVDRGLQATLAINKLVLGLIKFSICTLLNLIITAALFWIFIFGQNERSLIISVIRTKLIRASN